MTITTAEEPMSSNQRDKRIDLYPFHVVIDKKSGPAQVYSLIISNEPQTILNSSPLISFPMDLLRNIFPYTFSFLFQNHPT